MPPVRGEDGMKTGARTAFGLVACLSALALCVSPACTPKPEAPLAVEDAAANPDAVSATAGDAALDASTTLSRATVKGPRACAGSAAVSLFVSPSTPVKGKPVRVVAFSEKPLAGTLAANGGSEASANETRGGPPYFLLTEVVPTGSKLAVSFAESDCEGEKAQLSLEVPVSASRRTPFWARTSETYLWTATRGWDDSTENLYSAWIEALFDAKEGESLSYAALHEVLRDPKRNFLYDHLGLGEDSDHAQLIRPDCADLPYVLRATFAWKLGLPFGMAECSRGGSGAPPDCKGLVTQADPPAHPKPHAADAFGLFVRGTLADRVHSGSGRAPFADDESDYYPVALTWDALRPGTVFADPYGHVLVVAKRLPETNDRGGVLYAVDGQPDGTVGRKRFWRGNFLFAKDPALGGPGFKRFRPIVYRGGVYQRSSDALLGKHPSSHYSAQQASLDADAFYDAMDDVLAPSPRDPLVALREVVVALDEQVRTRVTSIENGRKFLEKKGPPAPMPEGEKIFEALGPWEDFSTPSRDLRLLIAIDVAKGFSQRVARRANRYATNGKSAEETKASLDAALLAELKARKVQYTRTDGSSFELTLAEVLSRETAFEMTYNPNDCVESRWGAPPGSDEVSTCKAHAPADQRARMESVRAWFHERKRPAR